MSAGGMRAAEIDPDLLLRAYAMGMFPMSEDADDDQVFWVQPEKRGVIPLHGFHAPKSLLKTVRQGRFEIRIDQDFHGVLDGCAESKDGRERTWINGTIRNACHALFQRGNCHTVEAYFDEKLAGGLYGVSLGGAFFGESMFSRMTDASKVCLVHLVERLRARRFALLDTQFLTAHLARFGAVEISRKKYERLLAAALETEASFFP
jgi:leucyl/phenylalanyl-tRNA---protein transferase